MMISPSEEQAPEQSGAPKTIDEVFHYVQRELALVESTLEQSLQSEVLLIPQVGKYMVQSGGKRIRPLLSILSSRLCGYTGGAHILMAAVVELIHTATLLHDDVVDHAELRRGERSVNNLWSNETSILVGDFLFTQSFSLMVEHRDMRILELMSKTCRRLAEGEILELAKSGDLNITEDDYLAVIRNKTAVLLSAACRIGAILGESPEMEQALSEYGMNLGMAFQVVDDALDFEAAEEELGKTIGKDLQEGKITLPMIRTLSRCTERERNELVEIIRSRCGNVHHLHEIHKIIQKYDGIQYTHARARRFVKAAKEKLEPLSYSHDKAALMILADFVADRKK